MERLDRMRAAMAQAHLDDFYCRNTSNVRWLTGFEDVFDTEEAHLAYVSATSATLHTDSRYSEAAARAAEGTLWQVDASSKGHAAWAAAFAQELHDAGGRGVRLGIEQSMTLGEFRQVEKAFADAAQPFELVETDDVVRGLRAVKDAEELRALRAAQAITDAAFAHIIGFMKVGMTELEVKIELEETMRRLGAEDLAFTSIVASGANGASPHAIASEKRLEEGDMVVMDFGARKGGYCADMTRSVCMGYATELAGSVYAAVREANETVEAALRVGMTGAEAHAMAEGVLAAHGFAGKMGHGLGHGVGLDIHELPNLSPRNEKLLVAGNVVTVEPGVYLAGQIGCRLEDCGVLTDDGYEPFGTSTHELLIVG